MTNTNLKFAKDFYLNRRKENELPHYELNCQCKPEGENEECGCLIYETSYVKNPATMQRFLAFKTGVSNKELSKPTLHTAKDIKHTLVLGFKTYYL